MTASGVAPPNLHAQLWRFAMTAIRWTSLRPSSPWNGFTPRDPAAAAPRYTTATGLLGGPLMMVSHDPPRHLSRKPRNVLG